MESLIRKTLFTTILLLTIAAVSVLALPMIGSQLSYAEEPEDGIERDHSRQRKNMKLVGHDDLQARSAYQPIIQEQNGRWIAYVGHHNGSALNPLTGVIETNGVSIVDVTDPKRPVYLHHLPGARGAQMVQTCRGADLPAADASKIYLLRSNGAVDHQVWDVTDPRAPTLVSPRSPVETRRTRTGGTARAVSPTSSMTAGNSDGKQTGKPGSSI